MHFINTTETISDWCIILIIVYFLTAGRPPGPELDNCTDRESYSLAAGLALGLVMFGVRYATYTVGTDVDLVLGKHTIVQSTLLFFFAGSDQRSKGKKLTFPFFKQPNIWASWNLFEFNYSFDVWVTPILGQSKYTTEVDFNVKWQGYKLLSTKTTVRNLWVFPQSCGHGT